MDLSSAHACHVLVSLFSLAEWVSVVCIQTERGILRPYSPAGIPGWSRLPLYGYTLCSVGLTILYVHFIHFKESVKPYQVCIVCMIWYRWPVKWSLTYYLPTSSCIVLSFLHLWIHTIHTFLKKKVEMLVSLTCQMKCNIIFYLQIQTSSCIMLSFLNPWIHTIHKFLKEV